MVWLKICELWAVLILYLIAVYLWQGNSAPPSRRHRRKLNVYRLVCPKLHQNLAPEGRNSAHGGLGASAMSSAR
jgi:hypothetical protein